MKTRVTFRVNAELAHALRDLPNQTDFVERTLREALRQECPACGGSGRLSPQRPRVSNFRTAALSPLTRGPALELRRLVRLARKLAATNVELVPGHAEHEVGFSLLRGSELLLRGSVSASSTRVELS
jgi:hypothetical protein